MRLAVEGHSHDNIRAVIWLAIDISHICRTETWMVTHMTMAT